MLDVHWDIGATVGSGLVLCGLGISRGLKMAEREGFEPPIPVKVYTLSRRAPSATRPSLRARLAPGILSVVPTVGPQCTASLLFSRHAAAVLDCSEQLGQPFPAKFLGFTSISVQERGEK